MDSIQDGLATPRLRQCFEACEDKDMPFLAIQDHQIHREYRDEPETYHAVVDSALHHPSEHDKPNECTLRGPNNP